MDLQAKQKFEKKEQINPAKVPIWEIFSWYGDLDKKKSNPSRFTAVCPFCGAKPGNFWLFKAGNNFKCFVCSESGTGVNLVMKMAGLSYPLANEEIIKNVKEKPGVKLIKYVGKKQVTDKELSLQQLILRNAAYSVFIEASGGLTASDRSWLKSSRGLTDEEIDKLGFFTFPEMNNDIFKRLNAPLGANTFIFKNVPGFFTRPEFKVKDLKGEHGEPVYWYGFNDLSGVGIPIHDVSGKIIAIQVRRREKYAKPKYLWMTSSNEEDPMLLEPEERKGFGGTSAGSPAQAFVNIQSNKVFFVEGFFKGYALSKKTCGNIIAVSGMSTKSAALARLDELIEQRHKVLSQKRADNKLIITMMFDADMSTNKLVVRNVLDLGTAISDKYKDAVQVRFVLWPLSAGKGIDDVIQNGNFVENTFVSMSLEEFSKSVEAFEDQLQDDDFQKNTNGTLNFGRIKSSAKFDDIFLHSITND